MFRSRLRLPRQALSTGLRPAVNARRRIHHVPKLEHDFTDGVPNLMSPGGFAIAWTDYMSLTIDKLNALTAGTELEDRDAKSIALMTAREPIKAPIFNYASMAHNNHFFFQGITPTGTPMPEVLRRNLENSFSSLETLRREFVVMAGAMFGPGFVWLVRAGASEYRLLPTYLAGSPYAGAHWRNQEIDMNLVGANDSARVYFDNQLFGWRKRMIAMPPGGIDIQPLLCLNTWEHAWLLDWGVGAGGQGGKTAYVEAWWDLIDWEKVQNKAVGNRPALKVPV